MPRIIVLGGGVCGLAASMLLARDGHEVTVLERDPAPVPETLDDAWSAWERGGVAQFHQPHFLQPAGRAVLDEALPDVRDALAAAGATTFDALTIMPPTITDRAPRAGDERFPTITARRPTLEWVFARAAATEPGVDVRRGVPVETLETTVHDGTPHVTGVRTASGDTLTGDLVVDAMGRRSQLPGLLARAGAGPVHEEAEDSGFIYYTRYFRVRDGGTPPDYRAAPLTAMPSFSVLCLPGDNDTWSVTLYIASGDRALKGLRHERVWDAVLAACPRHAHWADGEPLTGVMAMGGIADRTRRTVVDGRPVATGVLALADAWACTNPSLGRGVTFGLLHARRLRDVARYHLEHPPETVEVWDAATEAELTPWIRATIAEDRARRRALEADRTGAAPPPPDEAAAVLAALPLAGALDPDLFRAYLAIRSCLDLPEDVLARPGLAEHVLEIARAAGPRPPMGPDRAEVLALL